MKLTRPNAPVTIELTWEEAKELDDGINKLDYFLGNNGKTLRGFSETLANIWNEL